ncbi:LysR family transcriptional regulator [uncultured Maribacter sp.]|uniref:LysR family transcriptional regulator n=1 Tax=uncultured Maribacter sp. TaxID=431308 RepID=UPI0026205929|nr:LysR family transcriptional regulator [uncultured Maribacter sp.]
MISITNQIELRQLRYFIAVATTLHFRKAAEELGISQSALSQQIQLLEAMLNVKLLNRTNRKVSLNRSGKLFLEEAVRITKQVDDSITNWKLKQDGSEGLLKIAFVASAMQHILPPILKIYDEKYPNTKLQLEELTNKEQIIALQEKSIDIAFVRTNKVHSKIQLQLVFEEYLTLVLPENHFITENNFKDMSSFSESSFILFPNENSPMYFQQILNLCSDYGFSPKIAHKSIHAPTIFKLVENGMGISIIPKSLRDNFNYKVRYIDLKNIPQKTTLYAAWHKENDNPVLQQLLDLI